MNNRRSYSLSLAVIVYCSKLMYELPLDMRLYRCPERQVGVELPIPLSGRLDVLREIGEDAWAPTRRKELLSALLLAAPSDGRALKQILARYRTRKVSDAFVEPYEHWRFLYPPTSPGPRAQLTIGDEPPPSAAPTMSIDEALCSAQDYRIGMMVASPLAGRLKILLSLVKGAGENTSQRELIGAIVLAAPASGAELARMLERYWHGTVSDALVAGRDGSVVLAIPGRERSRSRRQTRRAKKRPAVRLEAKAPPGAKRSVKSRVEAATAPIEPRRRVKPQ
jgi:hypothetical protein